MRTFLLVDGSRYASKVFEDTFFPEPLYHSLRLEGVKSKTFMENGTRINVTIVELDVTNETLNFFRKAFVTSYEKGLYEIADTN